MLMLSYLSVTKVYAIYNENTTVIYIDPGHGGFDGGATSIDKNTIEKDICLKTCIYLQEYLEKTGMKVYLTRYKDMALAKSKKEDIHKRVKLINDSNADIYLSIHANSYPATSVKGAQTFYNDSNINNKYLASSIMKWLKEFDKDNKRVEKSISGKYLLDYTTKIGCLVEIGFLTNDIDLANLKNDNYLMQIAFYIYLGILDYTRGT